jgi:chromosomal replication initiator protein
MLTETQLKAAEQRKRFHASIAARAAALAPAAAAAAPVIEAPAAPPASVLPASVLQPTRVAPSEAREVVTVEPRSLYAREIVSVVATYFGVTVGEMRGARRTGTLITPRHVAMYLVSDTCPHLSLPAIGRFFGGRDHTTILYAVRKVDGMLNDGGKVAAAIVELRGKIAELARLPVAVSEIEEDEDQDARPVAYPSIERVQRIVARYYHLTTDDLVGQRRERHVRHARAVAIYLSRMLTDYCNAAISEKFGSRRHTGTVSCYVENVSAQLGECSRLAADIQALTDLIKWGAGNAGLPDIAPPRRALVHSAESEIPRLLPVEGTT